MNDEQLARQQAMGLVLHALDLDEQGYIDLLNSVDNPWWVANRLCELLVQAIPELKRDLYARQLRAELMMQLI